MEDVLKSYLVSLGFKIDSASFGKMQDGLKKLDKSIADSVSAMAKNYVIAGGVIVSALTSVAGATVDLMGKVAAADLTYQKLALRMYMTRDAAKQFKIVTDSMGEDPGNIAWIKELNIQYKELMGLAKRMETPGDAEGQLKYIRSIGREFTKMKVEATYGLQWITYYLFKEFKNEITNTKTTLEDLNKAIEEKTQKWAAEIAKWAKIFYGFAETMGEFVWDIIDSFLELYNTLGEGEKYLLAFGIAITALFVAGPIGRALIVIGLLTAGVNDFYGAMKGKETAFPIEVWWAAAAALDALAKGLIAVYLAGKLATLPIRKGFEFATEIIPQILASGLFIHSSKSQEEFDKRKTISGAVLSGKWKKFTEDEGSLKTLLDPKFWGDSSMMDRLDKKSGGKFFWTDEMRKAQADAWDTAHGIGSATPGVVPPGYVGVRKLTPQEQVLFMKGKKYDPFIEASAKKYNVDPNMIKAIMSQESSFDEKAISSAGARGLMQLMPITASGINPFNPGANIDRGTQYYSSLLKKYKGNSSLALAEYNSGSVAMNKYGGNQIPPYPETQGFVSTVQSRYEALSGITVQKIEVNLPGKTDQLTSADVKQAVVSAIEKINTPYFLETARGQ